MDKNFRDIERKFNLLSERFKQKKISERDYKEQLRKLRLKDAEGKCWTIGARSGKWYFFDGKSWVEATPPSIQEGKTICIYCGYENDLMSMTCAYCGGNMDEGPIPVCPQCGTKLEEPDQDCPACSEKKKTYSSVTELKSQDAERDDVVSEEEGAPNAVFRSVNLFSVFLFMSAAGLISGLVFGVFLGTTPFFSGIVQILPSALRDLQGNLTGGIFFGLLGGLSGAAILGAVGSLLALVVNAVLLLIGGIKFRADKII